MRIQILTLFPEMVMQGLSAGIIGRAVEQGLLVIEAADIRDYTADKHRKVDDYPYGGGAGMLMQAQPVYDAWCAAGKKASGPVRTIYLTPQGETFTQEHAKRFAREEDLILLCGHYEGIDERVLQEIVTDYISIGDYVLTGGELAAMVLTDAVARMVPGVLGNELSGETESFEGELLEYPQYSRPRVWMGRAVPDVLLSGDQRQIDAWRKERSVERTRERRPDLYERYLRQQECLKRLKKQKLLHVDMTELIARGRARIWYADGDDICIEDQESGILFHTATDVENGCRMLGRVLEMKQNSGTGMPELLTLHQEFMLEPATREYGFSHFMTCHQAVYTRREKLPVRGMYRMEEEPDRHRGPAEGSVSSGGDVPVPDRYRGPAEGSGARGMYCTKEERRKDEKPLIRRLATAWADEVAAHYEMMGSAGVSLPYIRERMEKGWMYGIFVEGRLAGFAGMHEEGSLGLLTILPQYRGRGLGRALETAMVNLMLERGFTPYGQVETGNLASRHLQESLGLCFSRTPVFWMSA